MRACPRAAFTLALAMVVGAQGCDKTGAPGVSDDVVVARARAAIGPFKASLREALTGALVDGPQAAIDVCSKRAPDLARAASRDGVTVGRSGRRLRNQANAPRPWLGPVMDRFARAPSESDAHEVVALPDGRRGYAEAIWMGAPCLLCHGENIAPAVDERLRQRYPTDGARGFKAGELRGVFWAELDPEALQPSAAKR